MSPRSLIILLFLFVVQEVYAQKFSPGYYVKSSGDTVKTNLFLQKKNGEITRLETEGGSKVSIIDVKAIRFNGVNYVVRIATLDKSPKAGIAVVDTVVMEVMSRENISLLYSLDQFDKSHFFIEGENGSIDELGLRVLNLGNGVTFQELPVYKDKLKALFPTCENLFPEISKARYTKSNIRSVYEKLYQCKYGSKPKTESAKEGSSDFGLVAGVSSTKLSFSNINGGGVASSADWNNSTNVTGGIFMENRFARTGDRFSLRHELLYRSYDASAKDLSTTPGYSILPSVSASYIKYNLMARIALSHTAWKPFLSAGVSPSWLLSSSSKTLIIDGNTQRETPLLGETKSFEFGFVGGAGLIYDDFSLEVRYEQSNGLDPKNYNSKVNTLYVILSYRIFEGKR